MADAPDNPGRPAAAPVVEHTELTKHEAESSRFASYPPAIAQLTAVVRAITALATPDAIMPYHAAFQAAHTALDEERDVERRQQYIQAIERLVPGDGLARIYVLSFLTSVSQDARYPLQLLQTLKQPVFTLEQRHFFYWQLLTRHGHTAAVPELALAAVYLRLLESCRKSLNIRAAWISPEERNADHIVVITNQLLGLQHQPTRDCIDYCHVLQTRLNKKVLLINTADMPWSLTLPYYNPMRFNYSEDYSNARTLTFKGERFDFYQCREPMPNRREAGWIVTTVLTRKPAFVLSLGYSNVAADLCSEFLTVASMPFGTNLTRAISNVYILPRTRRPDDAAFMDEWKIAPDQIVETEYTYRLPERTASLTRADLRLPQDAYVIAIVGNRLDEEITAAVAAELSALIASVPQVWVAFLGRFPGFSRVAQEHPVLGARSTFLGYHQDVLSVYECCDGYWNPPRYGGGASAAFALAMGLPVLTRNTGDVASIVGARFVFGSCEEIQAFVQRSIDDPGHRLAWAAAARAHFATISDREAMLRTIIDGTMARAEVRSRLV